MSNYSTNNNFEVTCFVKMTADNISFKTNFHQFCINSTETFGNLLNNMLHYHLKQNFISEKDCIELTQSS